MKSLTTLIASLLVLSANLSAATLSIELVDISVSTGTIGIQLVDSKAIFDGGGTPVAAKQIKVTGGETLSLKFEDLKPGKYAVMVMHDENDNGKLDSNILGIPKEGYGFSNNPNVMRRPTFEEAMVEVEAADKAITINIL